MGRSAVLEEKHSLPGTESGFTVDDRNHFAGSGEGHSEMTGTVVGTFVGVNQIRQIFRNQIIKKGMKIGPGRWIGIFHDDETGTGMPYKDSDLPAINPTGPNESLDLVGDFISPFSCRFYRKFFLKYIDHLNTAL